MRQNIQALYDRLSGRKVFIIGGGPSVKTQNLQPLIHENVICLNTAYELFSNPVALYWADENWAAKHFDKLEQHQCKLRFHSKFHVSDQYLKKDELAFANATILKRTGDYGIDFNIDCVRGNNSGAQILNLLLNIKVKEIVLLGYDMKLSNGKSHWHGGHGLPIRPDVYHSFIESINSMAPFFKSANIDVYNTNFNSDLQCFKKVPLEKCL